MTTNPWDVREPDGAEKDPDKLYLSIGRALTEWEWTEQKFAHLFGFLCGGYDTLQARRAYGSVVSFRGRSEMLQAASEAYFRTFDGHTMEDRFNDLLKLAGKYSPRRNEIAHGVVQAVYYEFPPGHDIVRAPLAETLGAARWLLVPPEYATNKNKLMPAGQDDFGYMKRKYAYMASDIDHYAKCFRSIRDDLWTLMLDWSHDYPEAGILPPI